MKQHYREYMAEDMPVKAANRPLNMRKASFYDAKCMLLRCEMWPFIKRNTLVYEAKHGDLYPFGRVFNLSEVKGETTRLHNSLNIKLIKISARNASFSIINVFWGVRLQKMRQIC